VTIVNMAARRHASMRRRRPRQALSGPAPSSPGAPARARADAAPRAGAFNVAARRASACPGGLVFTIATAVPRFLFVYRAVRLVLSVAPTGVAAAEHAREDLLRRHGQPHVNSVNTHAHAPFRCMDGASMRGGAAPGPGTPRAGPQARPADTLGCESFAAGRVRRPGLARALSGLRCSITQFKTRICSPPQ
jgi:hypothetical protein